MAIEFETCVEDKEIHSFMRDTKVIQAEIAASDPAKGLTFDEVEYYEYECGSYCSENGCRGHVTDIPVAITINGVMFWVDEAGNFPGGASPDEIRHVIRVVRALQEHFSKKTI